MAVDRVKMVISELNDKKYKDALDYLKQMLEAKFREPRLSRETEWETAKAAVVLESKLEALDQFFDLIENYEGLR